MQRWAPCVMAMFANGTASLMDRASGSGLLFAWLEKAMIRARHNRAATELEIAQRTNARFPPWRTVKATVPRYPSHPVVRWFQVMAAMVQTPSLRIRSKWLAPQWLTLPSTRNR